MHHLDDLRLEPVGVLTEGGDRGPHPREVAMVIGPEDVDQPSVGALELVVVVRDVRGEVRGCAVRADEHAILVVAEGRRPQPDGSLALIDVPALAQLLDRRVERPALVHGALR